MEHIVIPTLTGIGAMIVVMLLAFLAISKLTAEKEAQHCSICQRWHRNGVYSVEPFPDHSGTVKTHEVCPECEAGHETIRKEAMQLS